MDVCESEQPLQKLAAVDTTRSPLLRAEKNNAPLTTRRPRRREVSSRYKSSTPSRLSRPRRCPSPNLTRTPPTPSQLVQKRAVSAERKQPSTPPSPRSPSTPVHDSLIDTQISSRRLSTGRIPESLWPSTMRSLSVSFQSDTISIPVNKKEKEKAVSNVSLDRTSRPSSNVAHRQQSETPTLSRKPTPERKKSPLKGKNAPDQSENAKLVEGLPSRLIVQHRWPSIGGKLPSNSCDRSLDLGDKIFTSLSIQVPGMDLSSLKRMLMSDSLRKPLQKSASDPARLLSLDEIGWEGSEANSIDKKSPQVPGPARLHSASSLDEMTLATPGVKSHSFSAAGSRHQSPRRSSVSRVVSPSRVRPSPPPSRGVSTSHRGVSSSRMRTSTSSTQSHSSSSVLSFIADFKKGRKSANHIKDAHQLRLFYNRYLQWRFTNAQADAAMYIQKVAVEENLYNVWNVTLSLWDDLIKKKVNLQQLKLELKLNSVLNEQMAYLNEWTLLERDHISSLAGAIEDLEASTLRLPVTAGARGDIESLKSAICSAVDVMQAIGSSICSLLSKVEGVNNLVSVLAAIAAQEKNMLDQCEALLASTAVMQLEECSLLSHLLQTQTKEALKREQQPKHSMALTRTPCGMLTIC